MASPEKKYVTIAEFSQLSSLSVSTLRRRVREGSIAFFQPGGPGTLILFPRDALERHDSKQLPSTANASEPNLPPKSLPGRRPAWMDGPPEVSQQI